LLDNASADDVALANAIRQARPVVLAARIDALDGHWRKPNDKFLESNVLLGHVHADPDFDGISRGVYSAKAAEGSVLRAFSLEILRNSGMPVDAEFEQPVSGAAVVRPQAFKIRFIGDSQSFPQIPAWQVLSGQVNLDAFRDKIVLIG